MDCMHVDNCVDRFGGPVSAECAACPWTPLDPDVGPCSSDTPGVDEFYASATDVRCMLHTARVGVGVEHQIASVVSTHPHIPPGRVCLVMLGHSEDFDYVTHFIVDTTFEKDVRIEAGWTQEGHHNVRLDSTRTTRCAPISRVVFEVFGRPLHLWSALVYSVGADVDPGSSSRRTTIPPLMRLGCLTCNQTLLQTAHMSFRRRSAAHVIQTTWRQRENESCEMDAVADLMTTLELTD